MRRSEAAGRPAGGGLRPESDHLYIAEDNPERATSFVEEMRVMAALTAQRPGSFPARDDLAPGLRIARHGRYLIVFEVGADDVRIVRVLPGARNLARSLTRERI